MNFVLQPWQLLLAALAGWVNRKQQAVIDFQGTQIQVLMEKLGKKRLLLSDDQRRRLAVKAKVLGRKALLEITTIFTPDTILRWHWQLVAKKWDQSHRGRPVGRPPVSDEIVELVVRIARANPTWGYDRLQGALANLGRKISDQTVGNISEGPGHRASTRAEAKDYLEDVLEVPLGVPRGDGFHHRRGLDPGRAGDLLPALCDARSHQACPFCRLYAESG